MASNAVGSVLADVDCGMNVQRATVGEGSYIVRYGSVLLNRGAYPVGGLIACDY